MANTLNTTKALLPSPKAKQKSIKKVMKHTTNAHKDTPIKFKIGKKASKKTGLV